VNSVYPCVVWANFYQFTGGERVDVPRLESRMLLWCRRGTGGVTIDGTTLSLPPGAFALLPWGVRIRYAAARHKPFELGGAHLVPCYASAWAGTWRPGAAHGPTDPLAGSRSRANSPGLPAELICGDWSHHPALLHLAEYLAASWTTAVPNHATARGHGDLLMSEFTALAHHPQRHALPVELQRMLAAIQAHPSRTWMLADLAGVADCSSAWLTRLSMLHLRRSPCRHVTVVRLERGCSLLRQQTQTIAAIGVAIGISDASRFAKIFRSYYGISPLVYRQRQRHL